MNCRRSWKKIIEKTQEQKLQEDKNDIRIEKTQLVEEVQKDREQIPF